MKTSALAFSFSHRQHGAASVAIVMLLVFILAAAVMAVMRISGTSLTDTALNETQTAALSLAESGLERAQAILSAAAKSGGNMNNACINLKDTSSTMPRGSFKYTAATFNAGTSECTVTVMGKVDPSSRTIRAVLNASTSAGVEGKGSTINLNVRTTSANAGVIANLAYSADLGGSNATASIGTCTNCTNFYTVNSGASKKPTNVGVYAGFAAASTNTITETLVRGANPDIRNYVEVAAAFYPVAGAVSLVGSYAVVGGSTTSAGSPTGGSVPATWNCAANSATGTNVSVAAGADTLVYGFSSAAPLANQLKDGDVTFGYVDATDTGRKLKLIRNMTGKQGDNLYSQIWYDYNPAHLSGTGTTSGAVVTGYAGKGTIDGKTSGTKLCVKTITESNGTFSTGDEVSWTASGNARSCKLKSNKQSTVSGLCDCNGGHMEMGMCKEGGTTYQYHYDLETDEGSSSSSSMLVAAKLLTVTAASKPYLEVGDTIIVNNNPKGIIVSQKTADPIGSSGGKGTYELDSNQLFSSSTNNITSNGTIISTSAGTIPAPNGIPSVDTLIAKTSGTGNLAPGTTVISTPVTATLQFTNSATKYRISKQPTTPLSGAQLCGGVCAFMDNDGSSTAFTLANVTSGTDWSSGFTCLSNVDKALITAGETIESKRTQWSEVVQ